MKSILIISCVFPPEPIVSAEISYSIANLLGAKYDLTVLCPKPTRPYGFKFEEIYQEESFNKITLKSYTSSKANILYRFFESFSFGWHARNYIHKNFKNIDTIYINVWPIFAQYLIVNKSRKHHIRSIIHIQDIYPESLINKLPLLLKKPIHKLLLPIDKYILREVDSIVAISKRMVEYLVLTRKIKPNKFNLVQNWQDEETFINFSKDQKKGYLLERVFTFMYLGNIGPVASVEFLIESFGVSSFNNCRLVIAGAGSKKDKCIKLSRKFPESRIEFWDVPPGSVPEIQSFADVMLLPIKKGGGLSSIPSKLLSYMFSQKPIIASVDNDSDTAYCILEANCGIVTIPENSNQLIESMKQMLNAKQSKLEEFGINGFHYAMSNFSKRINLKKLERIILTD